MQVTCQRPTENTRSGVVAMCQAAPGTDRDSYKIIYSWILKEARNGRNCLILLVGAGRFELPTPCAQGRCATWPRQGPTGVRFAFQIWSGAA